MCIKNSFKSDAKVNSFIICLREFEFSQKIGQNNLFNSKLRCGG